MLGTLRLLLAFLVAISHADVRWFGLNPGVSAVAGFYLISGYVMAGLLRRHYPTPSGVWRFYLDRAFRLLPAYYAILGATVLWYLWHGPLDPYLSRPPSSAGWLANLLVVPLNFSMWNGANRFAMIPPAWSLGAEIQFYLLFPWIVFGRIRWLAIAASLAVFAAAFVGAIQTEWYGYRLLPGVLFMFLLGAWLHDRHDRSRQQASPTAPPPPGTIAQRPGTNPQRPENTPQSAQITSRPPRRALHARGGRRTDLAVAALLLAIVLAAALGHHADVLRLPYNREILLGLGLTLPALHLLARLPARRWDERAGDLSYGLFLSHFLAFWLWPGAQQDTAALSSRLALALAIAWLVHRLVERPVIAWRGRLLRDRTDRDTVPPRSSVGM